jgi:hypothetical protein
MAALLNGGMPREAIKLAGVFHHFFGCYNRSNNRPPYTRINFFAE